jgi:hypothetical protein
MIAPCFYSVDFGSLDAGRLWGLKGGVTLSLTFWGAVIGFLVLILLGAT